VFEFKIETSHQTSHTMTLRSFATNHNGTKKSKTCMDLWNYFYFIPC